MKPFVGLILSLMFLSGPAFAAGAENNGPGENRPWRVIYVEGGPYRDYHLIMVGLIQGLYDLGLIDEPPPPENGETEESARLWQWLARKAGGKRLEFLADGFYSAAWSEARLAEDKKNILARLARGEADLILALGTAAGTALITDEHQTPLLLLTATDPVAAGLSRTAEDSGRDNVHVQVLAGNVEYQMAMFHNIFGFKTLGVPVDSTPEGRNTMGFPTVERIAAERGFKVVPCLTDLEIEDMELSFRNFKNCLDFLAAKSEAVYLPVNNGLQPERLAELLEPLIAHQRPSFSQSPMETRLGVLLSLGDTDFTAAGRFEAEVLQAVLKGAQPRSLNQIYLPPLTMALNLKMAQLIGWNPPFEVLAAVDELYNQVAGRD